MGELRFGLPLQGMNKRGQNRQLVDMFSYLIPTNSQNYYQKKRKAVAKENLSFKTANYHSRALFHRTR